MRCMWCGTGGQGWLSCDDCWDWYWYLDAARKLHPYQLHPERYP